MKNIVHLIDNMEFMSGLPDNAYDLAIVDPPYGININMNMGIRKGRVKKFDLKNWDKSIPDNKYFSELFRVSVNQIIWGGNYFPLHSTGAWIFWYKHVPKGVTFADGELAWTSFNSVLRIADVPYSGIIGRDGRDGRIHPTQKPVALYKWLLKNYAKPGQTIFDSHVGSGSSRIACHDMGFDFEGCELAPDYWQAQEKRYKKHIEQTELFSQTEIQPLIFSQEEL